MKRRFFLYSVLFLLIHVAQAKTNYADYVSTLVGTDSNFELSTGNT